MKRGQRTCLGKIPHATREAAVAAMGSLARDRGAHLGSMHVYRCPHCAKWHVGHRIGTGRKRRRT